MRLRSVFRALTATCAFTLAACSDSTGPGSVDANGALQSLALLGDVPSNGGTTFRSAGFLTLGGLLDRIDVTVEGKTQSMYGLGYRETFPPGSCLETIFITPGFSPLPGECTSPDVGFVLLLWQSHSAQAPPDRVLILGSDVGSGTFSFADNFGAGLPAFAFYSEGQDRVWFSTAGNISSQITATNASCSLPLPPYAVSADCRVANFDEQASIELEEFSDVNGTKPPISIVIPRQTIRGVWQSITQTRTVTLP